MMRDRDTTRGGRSKGSEAAPEPAAEFVSRGWRGPADGGDLDPEWTDIVTGPSVAARLERHATSRAIAIELSGLRRATGMSLRELSRVAGWDPAFVSRLEAGRGLLPTPATVARYARACGAEVGYAFRTSAVEVVVPFGEDVHDAVEPAVQPAADDRVVRLSPRMAARRAVAKS